MQDLISRFTLDSATEFLFGSCVHSLRTSLPYPHHSAAKFSPEESTPAEAFAQAFAEAQKAISFRARIGAIWPWFELKGDKTASAMRVVNAFLDPILKQALAKTAQEKQTGLKRGSDEIDEDETLLGNLVRLTTGEVSWCQSDRPVPD